MRALYWGIAICCLAFSVEAVDPGGYWSVFGGWSKPKASALQLEISGYDRFPYQVEIRDGYIGGISFGRQFEEHFRFELEVSGRYHDLGNFLEYPDMPLASPPFGTAVATDAAHPQPDGEVYSVACSVNAFVDLRHCCPFFIPFLGAGVGPSWVGFKDTAVVRDFWLAPTRSHSDYGWHWQLLGGITVLDDNCRRAWVRYRYKEVYPDIQWNMQNERRVRGHARAHAIEAGMTFIYW